MCSTLRNGMSRTLKGSFADGSFGSAICRARIAAFPARQLTEGMSWQPYRATALPAPALPLTKERSRRRGRAWPLTRPAWLPVGLYCASPKFCR